MPFATARAVSLHGAVGHLIDVQTDVSPGQVATVLVGRADAALNEARDRCRMAIINSGLEWPATKRITILLSPADLLKRGTHFDLAIAVSVLAADGRVPRPLARTGAFIGELTLDGGLRSVPGVLPMVLAAAERGVRRVFVPEPQAREAAMVPDMEVFGMRSLGPGRRRAPGRRGARGAPVVAPMSGAGCSAGGARSGWRRPTWPTWSAWRTSGTPSRSPRPGGHHLLLSGPKGAGKTSLAERIPGILPDLTR